jgi:hypothetical protein
MQQVETRIQVQKAEDLLRLAGKAEQAGVKILLTADGEHLATSASNPTALHRVSEHGCDCKGFSYWQRCTHHSLLLSQLGLVPDMEDVVVDEAPAPCRSCRGSGVTRAYTGGNLSDWVAVPCRCTRQHAAA